MRRLKDVLFFTLAGLGIVIGLLLVFSPWVKGFLVERQVRAFDLDGFSAAELAENQRLAGDVPWDDDIALPDFGVVMWNFGQVDRQDVLGAISIPDLRVNIPILNGTTTRNLLAGATTVNPGQVMGQGNYVLAGHHMPNGNLLFGPLLDAELGMMVEVTDRTHVYRFEVVEMKLVNETDFSILTDSNEPVLTLFTCDVPGNTPLRWVVVAELREEGDF